MERAEPSGQSSWDLGNRRSFSSGSFAPRRPDTICLLIVQQLQGRRVMGFWRVLSSWPS